MTYLLSRQGRQALRILASRSTLYAFDFDGTLAPISSDLHAAKMSRSVEEWLKELSKRAPCAVVSGRALGDLKPRISGTIAHAIGNHGLESPLTPSRTLILAEEICSGWRRELATDLAESIKKLGVTVEDKRYSITFHFRHAPEPARTRLAVLMLLEQLIPAPRIIAGNASVNALPPGERGKGQAVLDLMDHLQRTSALYIGDDETDEDVFALTGGTVTGVRVGHHGNSRAQYYLRAQDEIEQVIRFLVHRLDRTPEISSPDEGDGSDSTHAANDF